MTNSPLMIRVRIVEFPEAADPRAVVAAVSPLLPEGVTVDVSGLVQARQHAVEAALGLDWADLFAQAGFDSRPHRA